jgi:hypothetical protein
MTNQRNRSAWTIEKAKRFVYSSLASLRPKRLIIETLIRNGIPAGKAEKIHEEALLNLSPSENTALRASIAYGVSNLLETVEDALAAAASRGDWISHTQLLKLKQKALSDYAGQFTDKDGNVDKNTTDQEAILKLVQIFGNKDD